MRYLQFGFSTLIVGFSHDDFNLHHWLSNGLLPPEQQAENSDEAVHYD